MKLFIVQNVLLISTLGNVERTVWRICILMLECKWLIEKGSSDFSIFVCFLIFPVSLTWRPRLILESWLYQKSASRKSVDDPFQRFHGMRWATHSLCCSLILMFENRDFPGFSRTKTKEKGDFPGFSGGKMDGKGDFPGFSGEKTDGKGDFPGSNQGSWRVLKISNPCFNVH